MAHYNTDVLLYQLSISWFHKVVHSKVHQIEKKKKKLTKAPRSTHLKWVPGKNDLGIVTLGVTIKWEH